MSSKAAGGKNKKHGRNKDWCKAYSLRKQRERNKIKRLARHLARFPSDRRADSKIDVLRAIVSGRGVAATDGEAA